MWYHPDYLKNAVEAAKRQVGNLPEEERNRRLGELLEASWQRLEDLALSFKAGPDVLAGPCRFDTLSLGTWLVLAQAAGVSAIPAIMVALPKFSEIAKANFAPLPLDVPADLKEFPGMVRIDFCASNDIKSARSMFGAGDLAPAPDAILGTRMIDGIPHMMFDERLKTLIVSYVGHPQSDAIPIWWRPWVPARSIGVVRPKFMGFGKQSESWPLEWRVFVRDGRVAGVSSYYIQAPVPPTDDVFRAAAQAASQAQRLADHLVDAGIQPWHTMYLDKLPENRFDFSLDFLTLPDGRAELLEAGPTCFSPVKRDWGANPCCFVGRDDINGLALSREGPVLPLSVLDLDIQQHEMSP